MAPKPSHTSGLPVLVMIEKFSLSYSRQLREGSRKIGTGTAESPQQRDGLRVGRRGLAAYSPTRRGTPNSKFSIQNSPFAASFRKFVIKFKVMCIDKDTVRHVNTEEAIELENTFGAHNYAPLQVVIARGEGVFVWDTEGKRYYDFLSAYSALNHGHCHPRLVEALRDQAGVLTLTSRAFYNNLLGQCEQMLTNLFGYDKALMMNSGAEAVETAIKLARRWGYAVKGIADSRAVICVAANNFHGRTTTIISFSTDKSARDGFGPYTNGFFTVPYNDLESLEDAFKNEHVCAYLFEPVQGEAGVIVPDEGYIQGVRDLCTKYNVLMIADEIQTGMGRTGKLLCVDHENVHPDMIILGKALGGGLLPASAVLCDDSIMLTIKPGEHGSTFGGNPLAARVTIEAIQTLLDENMVENSNALGIRFRERMKAIKSPMIREVRGKGLFNAIRLNPSDVTGYDLCVHLKNNGLLAKQTHGNVIRFAPPLIMSAEQLEECCDIIEKTFGDIDDMTRQAV